MPKLMLLLALCCLSACQPEPQSSRLFAGLSDNNPGAKAVRGYAINFPADHGSHNDFAIEWWYLTANLQDPQNNHYALQWTLFRFRNRQANPPWANDQQFMAHASIHSADYSSFSERFARGGVGNAEVLTAGSSGNFYAWLDNWQWQSHTPDLFPAKLNFILNDGSGAQLSLTRTGDYLLHGDKGYSQKLADDGHASYYYSQPHIQLSGELTIAGQAAKVTGQGWFDHEWSGQIADDHTQGWDWFSIHLDDGSKLMLFRMRHASKGDYWSGTLLDAHGMQHALNSEQIKASVLEWKMVKQHKLPLSWQISLPEFGIELTTQVLKNDQWNNGLFRYYEGAIVVSGSHQGRGFMELTGY